MRILLPPLLLLTAACGPTTAPAPQAPPPARDDPAFAQAAQCRAESVAVRQPDLVARMNREIAAAAKHPLGGRRNPVRACFVRGEYAYLARLRCADGRPPKVSRIGMARVAPFGTITDRYDVDCGAAAPGRREVYIDMYHVHREDRPVPGFSIVPAG